MRREGGRDEGDEEREGEMRRGREREMREGERKGYQYYLAYITRRANVAQFLSLVYRLIPSNSHD